ncbi:hypothetical protein Skr01_74610 [Sphaerisporangium krabiense]|nr:hypothetical protein Skr01_74610 [Sphaerisporangium krabiense]
MTIAADHRTDPGMLGADHPHTLASRNNLAGAYRSTGDLARAIPLLEQALAGCEHRRPTCSLKR